MLEKLKAKLTVRNLLLLISLITGIVGFIIYMITATTGYFVNKSPNAIVLVFSILFILAAIAFIAFDEKIGKFDTIVFFFLACCIILSFIFFILDKEEVVAEMMNPVNHPQKQIDAATNTIVGVVFYGVSFIFLAASSFFDSKKVSKPAEVIEEA